MAIWKKGRGVWMKFCEECSKPFEKVNKTQKKCLKCVAKSRNFKKETQLK